MRFLTTVKSVETGVRPPEKLMQAMHQFIQEAIGKGVLYETGGLTPSREGKFYRIAGDELHVTDGPYAEAKEVVGGYAILECASRDEANIWATRFMQLHIDNWPGWEGSADLREMHPFAGTNVPRAG